MKSSFVQSQNTMFFGMEQEKDRKKTISSENGFQDITLEFTLHGEAIFLMVQKGSLAPFSFEGGTCLDPSAFMKISPSNNGVVNITKLQMLRLDGDYSANSGGNYHFNYIQIEKEKEKEEEEKEEKKEEEIKKVAHQLGLPSKAASCVEFEGPRLAKITDIHYRSTHSNFFNRTLSFDGVLITGFTFELITEK